MERIFADGPLLNDHLGHGLLAGAPNSTASEGQFTVFPSLPAELRLKIWQAVILDLQHRIVHVNLRPGREPSVMMELPPHEDEEAARGSAADIVNGSDDNGHDPDGQKRFAAGLEDIERCRRLAWSTVFPTVLRVSRESRNAYLSIFRIAMPFGTGGDDARRLVMHLSPDRDVLDLTASTPDPSVSGTDDMSLRSRMIISFLCHIRDRDPRGVGVRNLSLGAQVYSTQTDDVDITVDDILDQISPSIADESWESGAAVFTQILENLESFFYVSKLSHMARCNPGYPICPEAKPHFALSVPVAPGHKHNSLRACGCVSHAYLPSTPDVATFTWLDRDPRAQVSLDTRQIPSHACPHQTFRAWLKMEERLGVKRPAGSSFRRYLAVGEDQRCAFDRESARAHLRDEWGSWERWSDTLQEYHGQWKTRMGNLMSPEQQAAAEAEALPAVGLWLWQSEALERLSAEKPCEDHKEGGLALHDLSGSTPGLLVMHLA